MPGLPQADPVGRRQGSAVLQTHAEGVFGMPWPLGQEDDVTLVLELVGIGIRLACLPCEPTRAVFNS